MANRISQPTIPQLAIRVRGDRKIAATGLGGRRRVSRARVDRARAGRGPRAPELDTPGLGNQEHGNQEHGNQEPNTLEVSAPQLNDLAPAHRACATMERTNLGRVDRVVAGELPADLRGDRAAPSRRSQAAAAELPVARHRPAHVPAADELAHPGAATRLPTRAPAEPSANRT